MMWHSPNINKSSRHCNLVFVVLFLLLSLVQISNGQRVIASLGSRLKRRGKTKNKLTGQYIVEGEESAETRNQTNIFSDYMDFYFPAENDQKQVFVASAVVIVSICLLSFWNMKRQKEKEGESLLFIRHPWH